LRNDVSRRSTRRLIANVERVLDQFVDSDEERATILHEIQSDAGVRRTAARG